MEGVLLAGLLGPLDDVVVLRAELPVVDDLVAGNDDMRFAHGDMLGLNSDSFAIDRAAYGVAEDNIPLVRLTLILSNEAAVFVTGRDLLEAFHVLDVLLIDEHVPKDDAHVVSLWLSEGKDQGVREVPPHVLRLDVREEDVGVHSQGNAQAEPFPAHGVDHAGVGWDSQTPEMDAERVVELHNTLASFCAVHEGPTDR